MAFAWTCPFCNRDATINELDYSTQSHSFEQRNKYSTDVRATTNFIICPNPNCREFTVTTIVGIWDNGWVEYARFQLIPQTEMKVFPEYVPEAIRGDYEEACLIRHLSPKASATLSRRCLKECSRFLER